MNLIPDTFFVQVVDAPMLPTKFPYLKHLTVRLVSGSTISRPYDHFSLVSFLEASPFLQTLILNVRHCCWCVHSFSFHPAKLYIWPFSFSLLNLGPFNWIAFSFSSSGDCGTYGPWIDSYRFRTEAHASTPPRLPEEREDQWFQLCDELGWTCHILENATSLEHLTLDTIHGPRCGKASLQGVFPSHAMFP